MKQFYRACLSAFTTATKIGLLFGFLLFLCTSYSQVAITCPGNITANISDNPVSYTAPTLTNGAIAPATIPGYTFLGSFDSSSYYLQNSSTSAQQAYNLAVSSGYNLVSINSLAENNFIQNAMLATAISKTVIGYNDLAVEGTFVWQSGEITTYTNWTAGEPNNTGSSDYTFIFDTGLWEDTNDTNPVNAGIIEFNTGVVQIAGLPSGSNFPLGTTTNTFRAYNSNGTFVDCSFTVTIVDPCTVFTSNIAYVDANATGANNGSSWANAFTDLQDAITAINDCPALDSIYVAEGTYLPTATTDQDISFEIPANTTIYGGFSPNNGAIDLGTRDFNAYPTILSGDIGVPGITNDNTDTIVIITSNTAPITFDGITIRDGFDSDFLGGDATAVLIDNALGGINLTLNNCTISNNDASITDIIYTIGPSHFITINNSFITDNQSNNRAILYAAALTDVTITNTTIANNTSYSTMNFEGTDAVNIENCIFENNFGELNSGIYIEDGISLIVKNTTVRNNSAGGTGGGVVFASFNTPSRFENTLFHDNNGTNAAIYFGNNSNLNQTLDIIGCTITQNSFASGNSIFVDNLPSPGINPVTINITNTLIWDYNNTNGSPNIFSQDPANTVENFNYSLISGYVLTANNGLDGTNLANDPLFTDPATKDFTLQPTSPVIDLGDNTAITQPTDLNGDTRIIDGDNNGTATVDFGAFESPMVVISNIEVTASGDLEFIDNDDRDDDLTIVIDGPNYRLTDPVNTLIAGAGAIQIDPNTVDVPITSITGVLTINTLGGDDSLTLDVDGGNFLDLINYNGGTQISTAPGDILRLQGGGTFASVEHFFTNENDGSVEVAGNPVITYTGLEPIVDNLSVTDRVFTFTGADETITLSDDGDIADNESFIDSTLGENVTFTNPTNSLTINTEISGGSGADVINIEGLDTNFDADVTVNGGADDDANFQTNPTSIGSGSFNINARTISVTQDVSTTLAGSITLTASQNIVADSGANISAENGDINFGANTAATLAGINTVAISVNNSATIRTTGTGNIELTGVAVGDGTIDGNIGVRLISGTSIATLGSGTITITGTGGSGMDDNYGLTTNNATIQSNGSGITLNGTGGNGSRASNKGIFIDDQSTIEDLLSGDISLTGLGGSGNTENSGINMFGSSATITSNGGNIIMTGTGSSTSTSTANAGVSFILSGLVSTSGNGSITINGIGGNGNAANIGVLLRDAELATTDGPINVSGTGGGNGTGSQNYGVLITLGSRIEANGTGAINIDGEATNNVSSGIGTAISGLGVNISSIGGGISIIGQGSGTNDTNIGVGMWQGNVISDLGGGNIIVNGTGGIAPNFFNMGVYINQTEINTSGAGDIDITGTAGNTISSGIAITDFNSRLIAGNAVSMTVATGDLTTPAGTSAVDVIQATTVLLNGVTQIGTNSLGTFPDIGQFPILGNTVLSSSSELKFTIRDFTSPGTDYDQLKVSGTIDITDVTLILVDDTTTTGVVCSDEIIIIENDGTDAIIGTFAGLPEGTDIAFNTELWRISYLGGDGNDVSLVLNPGMVDPPICMDITVQLDAAGFVSIVATDVDGGTPMGCPFDSLSVNITDFDCSNIGSNNVTLTVTDTFGNTADCTAIVTVEDITAPTISCPGNQTEDFDANCEFILPDYTGLATVSDSCDTNPLVTQSPVAGTVITATTQITLVVEDASGNTNSCVFDVIPVDVTAPTITCPGDQNEDFDANCEFILPDYTALATVSDSCDTNPTVTQSPIPGTTITGTTQITLSAEDAYGNMNTCVFDVIPEDNTAPTITCPANQTEELDANCEFILPDYTGLATVSDSCDSNPTVTQSPIAGTVVTATTQITLFAEDVSGNINGCVFDVILQDTTAPTITCPPTQNETPDASCMFTLPDYTGLATAIDNCGTVTITQTPTPGTVVGIGNTTITLEASDGTNLSSCMFDVVVSDTSAPTITCPADQNVDYDSSCQFTLQDYTGLATTTDACDPAPIISQNPPAGTVISATTTITLTTTDASGNSDFCTFDVIPTDATPPSLSCPADQNEILDLNCEFVVPDYTNLAFVIDNCDPNPLLSQSPIPGTIIATTTVITIFAEDSNGNTDSCTFTVTLEDTTPPVITCPPTQNETADANCMFTLPDYTGLATATDNCGTVSITQTPPPGTMVGSGNTSITLEASDGINTSNCTFTVIVADTTPPTAVCQDITVQLDASGMAIINAFDIDNGSSDNCSIASSSVSPNTFSCADVGTPQTVTLTVTDASGNTSTCTSMVTVEDMLPPTAICQDITLILDASGNATLIPSDIDGGSTDNCGIASLSASQTAFTCDDIGPNDVILTITDDSGNTSSCTAIVTVSEAIDPIAVCQDITVQLDATGTVTILPADVDGGSSDNCAIDTLTLDTDTFTCADVGPNMVTLTVFDTSGNSSSCMAIVTVEDNVVPEAICQDITVILDANAMATIVASDVDGGSTDACGIALLEIDIDTFTCDDVGPNNVILTVTDVNGNMSSCVATVTIEEENTTPIAVCQNVTVPLGIDGTATIPASSIDAGSTGASCSGGLSLDIDTFDCSDVGKPVTVTLTVTNGNGVTDSCTAVVNVVDTLDPTITCPDDQVVQSDGLYTLPDYVANGLVVYQDNCGPLTTVQQDPAPGTMLDLGEYLINFTATDPSGNEIDCFFRLTIEELLATNTTVSLETVTLFPNPASEFIVIANPARIELQEVAIYDMTGRLVQNLAINNAAETVVPISHLASASYMVLITSETQQLTKQLVKE